MPALSSSPRGPYPATAAIPPFPRDTPRAAATVHLRFEDVTQDGRLVLEALPNALGPTVWRGLLQHDAAAGVLMRQGIVPILSRFVLEGRPGPFSASAPIEALGTFRMARAGDGRFMLDMWADLHGRIGRTYPSERSTDRDGEQALAGRVLAEHILTRPFAPPGERRVTSLDIPGVPPVTETRPAPPAYDAIAAVPEGATPLEPGRRVDPVPIVFGLVHTDSNMHVNSLVYLRAFEESALRRFAAIGRGSKLLGRSIDIAYRKPCFAGQTMRIAAQAFETGGGLGVAAVLIEQSEAASEEALARAKPHAYVRMTFEA